MLFTLVKNELIKIFSRTKTWIVIGLFTILVAGLAFINYKESEKLEYLNSPQGKIENLIKQKERNNRVIEDLKDSTESYAQDEINAMNLQNEELDKDIAKQQNLIDNASSEDVWKSEIEIEKNEIKKALDDGNISADSKEYYEERIKEIDTALEKNQKPVETWEFDGVNFMDTLIQVLGTVILASGIAIFMSDIVSGESTPPTLKFLLVQPIARGKVILSKFIAVVITVVGLIGGLELIGFGIVGSIGGFRGSDMSTKIGVEYTWNYSNLDYNGMPTLMSVEGSGVMTTRGAALFQSFGLQILFIVACCAFIFLISAIFKSSMTTMALSVILSVVATMGCIVSRSVGKIAHLLFFNYGATNSVISGNIAYNFNNPNFTVQSGIIIMCVTIVFSYALAHIIFSKKDILV